MAENPYVLPHVLSPASMRGAGRSPAWAYGAVLAVVFLAALPFGFGLFGPSNLHAGHDEAFGGESLLLGLHVVSDALIGVAYVAISGVLIYLARRAGRSIPFLWAFVAFGIFIVACGLTHFAAAVTVWEPIYWLTGGIKYVTAVVSVGTALAIPPLVPKVLTLVDSARVSEERRQQLLATNEELAALTKRLKEADELKTAFFANVSHELRTPLALILGPVGQLQAADGLIESQRHGLATVERNARLLLRHVNDLLDVARLDAGKMGVSYAEVDLARLVQLTASHFDPLAREREINFAVEAPSSLPAQVDPDKVDRILINLLANAFKFVPTGGTVRCVLRPLETRVLIDVEDSGPGVPPPMRSAIFERFQQVDGGPTRHFGGTGLGLAIVKEFATLHGGTVTVDDAAIGGARFRVDLPLHAPAGAFVAPVSPASEDRAGDIHAAVGEPTISTAPEAETTIGATGQPLVLVVEDHPEMRRFIGEVLAGDHRVVTAANGEEGLARARAEKPDLILSDVMMPGMSGDALVRALRAEPGLADIPVIVLTAKADDELRVRLLREGAQDYLLKPFSPEELRARVGNLLAMKRVRDVLRQELAGQHQDLVAMATELAVRKREAETAVQARNRFLAVAAHELRTPITTLKGFAELQVRDHQRGRIDAERSARTARATAAAANRLATLTDDLLDVARLNLDQLPLRRRPLDLGGLVRERAACIRAGAVEHGPQIVVSEPEGPCWVAGDPDRLGQVVTNLLDNATKYSPDGEEVVAVVRPDGEGVRVEISDQGIGLPAGAAETIFEPFERARNAADRQLPGLGLGLHICRGIVDRHGGWIRAESAGEGRGTTMVAWLPSSEQPSPV
ncbi:MAG: ATP-binding protein [Chloroflexota bacterium]|nr:ATP-binding protein [Chloroflexota bacterium]